MSIQDITVQDGLTTAPVFNGTTRQFQPDGTAIVGGLHLIDVTNPEFYSRAQMTVKTRPTVLNAKTGQLSKEKRSVSIAMPYIPANSVAVGAVTFVTARFELEFHPEAKDMATNMKDTLISLLCNSDAEGFLSRGSLT